MCRLHVITAVSRPENLPRLAETLAAAAAPLTDWQISWHWKFDLAKQHVGGQAVKNSVLNHITSRSSIVWFLDDDTTVHPDVLVRLDQVLTAKTDAVVFSQRGQNGSPGLRACRDNVTVGSIDIGQAFLRRKLIGSERLHHSYEGDGIFLERLLRPSEKVKYVDEPLILYNALR